MNHNRREFIAKTITTGAALAAFGAWNAQAQNTQRSSPGTNALMSMFDLKYPIFQAPTATAAGPDVTIAVSRAGGPGCNRTYLDPVRVGSRHSH